MFAHRLTSPPSPLPLLPHLHDAPFPIADGLQQVPVLRLDEQRIVLLRGGKADGVKRGGEDSGRVQSGSQQRETGGRRGRRGMRAQ